MAHQPNAHTRARAKTSAVWEYDDVTYRFWLGDVGTQLYQYLVLHFADRSCSGVRDVAPTAVAHHGISTDAVNDDSRQQSKQIDLT